MAKWGEIKCPRCEELEAKQQETFQMYVDANEARIDAEAKLAQQDDLVQAAVAAALTEAAEAVEDYCSDAPDLAGHGHSVGIRDYILALIPKGGE